MFSLMRTVRINKPARAITRLIVTAAIGMDSDNEIVEEVIQWMNCFPAEERTSLNIVVEISFAVSPPGRAKQLSPCSGRKLGLESQRQSTLPWRCRRL